ncbi:MAG: ABC transporter substrate binding protein [Desulfocapsaceae bacterium]|nr:ABC transporter substrate binding protein [Desulfocapsaceae bacterium]
MKDTTLSRPAVLSCLTFILALCFFLQDYHNGLCKEASHIKKILIVNSYEPGQVCGQPQSDGVLDALAANGFKEGKNLQVEQFFMDTRKTYTSDKQIEERGKLALERIKSFKPDLVVTLDDNAAKTVMLPLVGTSVPVVFSGINTQPEEYNRQKHFMTTRKKPGVNVTGVYEKLHIVKALDVMYSITGLHKAALLLDSSSTGNAVKVQVEKEMAEAPSPVKMVFYQVDTFEQFKQRIRAINDDPDIGAVYPVALTLKNANNKIITANEILTWQLANLKKPDMAGNYFLCKLGMFGGAAVDFKAMGEQVGRKAAAILNGTPAGDIPIDDADEQALVFNLERARKLGITIPMDVLSAADNLYDTIILKAAEEPIKLLIIQSYEQDTGCGKTIEKGLLEGLAEAGYHDGNQLAISHYYMDTQNSHITREEIIKQAQTALHEIERLKPRIVILMDDNAFEHVLPPLINSQYPVLFAGTNVPLEYYNRINPFMISRQHPGKNVTGITEEHELMQSLRLIKSLIPTAETAVTIYADSTPFAKQMAEANKVYIAEHKDTLPIRFIKSEKVTRLSDYQNLIKKYDNDPSIDLIYTFAPVSLIKDDGTISPVEETIAWMAKNQKKPGFTWMTNWVELGYLASAGIDLKATGRTLARKLIKVLGGTKPGDLPIENPSAYSIVLNQGRAKLLGVEIPMDILEAAELVYPGESICPRQ